MRFQVFSFASKKVQCFSSEKKILMSLLSVLFHLQNSVFGNFNFYPRYLGKHSLCLSNQPHFLTNSDKSFLSPAQKTRLCRQNAVEDNNAKISIFPNILCTFSLFKASAFLQIFFPRNLPFRQTSVVLNSKRLKRSNKRTHIPLFINQFVSLIELTRVNFK